MLDISFNIPYNNFVARNSSPKSRTLLPATINIKDYQKEIEMPKFVDITGKTFNKLTAVSFHHKDKRGKAYWLFRCSCGKEVITRKGSVTSGEIKSCGCSHKEQNITHGLSKSNLYFVFQAMKQRCYNKSNLGYSEYGGRGITICDEWLTNPESFYTWAIENGYKRGLSIDRIDNNKGYSPENCRWATQEQQQKNKRTNLSLTYKGKTCCASEWSDLYKVPRRKVYWRLSKGWSFEEALGIIERRPCESN